MIIDGLAISQLPVHAQALVGGVRQHVVTLASSTGTTASNGNLSATHAGTVITNLISGFSTLALGGVTAAFGGAMGYHAIMHHVSTDRSESGQHVAAMKALIAPTAAALGATGIAGYISTLVK